MCVEEEEIVNCKSTHLYLMSELYSYRELIKKNRKKSGVGELMFTRRRLKIQFKANSKQNMGHSRRLE